MPRKAQPTRRGSHRNIGRAFGVALLLLTLSVAGGQAGLAYAQPHATMTPGEWQALATRVALYLDQLGARMGVSAQIRAYYVRSLTMEYLQVFQSALVQGATRQYAEVLAARHVAARIQQLRATPPGYTGNNWGVTGPGYNRRGPFGDSMSDGQCSFVNGIPVGNCG